MAKVHGAALYAFALAMFALGLRASSSSASCPAGAGSDEDCMNLPKSFPEVQPSSVLTGALFQRSSTVKSNTLSTKSERPGSSIGVLMDGDVVYLKAHTGRYVGAENGVVTCQELEHGVKSMFRIEKDGGGGIHGGDTISLRTHEDKHVGAYLESVTADWDTYESSGMITDFKSIALVAGSGSWGPSDPSDNPSSDPSDNPWGGGGPSGGGEPGSGTLPPLPGGIQVAFAIEKEDSHAGYIRVGDQIRLRTYTTKHVNVDGTAVRAAVSSDSYLSEATFTIESDPKPPPPRRPYPDGPPGPDAIKAGDTVYLRGYKGKHLMVWRGVGPSVRCDWDRHGKMEAFTIEKPAGGFVHQGDQVFLRSWQGFHLLVTGEVVTELREGSWRPEMAFVIERAVPGTGAIQVNESIYLRAHTGKHLDVYKHWCPFIAPRVQVSLDDFSERSAFTIERDAPSGLPAPGPAPGSERDAPSGLPAPGPAPGPPKPVAKAYGKETNGLCAKPIKSEDDCKAAAAQLGVKYKRFQARKKCKRCPPACFVVGKRLVFNHLTTSKPCGESERKYCLCES